MLNLNCSFSEHDIYFVHAHIYVADGASAGFPEENRGAGCRLISAKGHIIINYEGV